MQDYSDDENDKNKIPRLENDEYFIHELVELERDFEDELFFECPEEELDQYYKKRAQKVEKVKIVGKILSHMDDDKQEFEVWRHTHVISYE